MQLHACSNGKIPTYNCLYGGQRIVLVAFMLVHHGIKQGEENSCGSMHFTPKLGVILTYNYIGLPLKIQNMFIS